MSDAAANDVSEVRAGLERERELLNSKVRELDAREGQSYDGNFADSGQVAAEQGENRVLYDQLRRDLDDIEKALEAIDEGTYGLCEVCGEPIGEARLEVMPATRVCITHA